MRMKIGVIILLLILNINFASAAFISTSADEEQDINSCTYTEDITQDAQKDPIQKIRAMINLAKKTDEQLLKIYFENITSFGPRVTGTPSCDIVANYIYEELKSLDLSVRYQNWSGNALSGKNIEATLKNSESPSDQIYVICAHYDSVPETNGADDNTAGTANVLAAAKLLSKYHFENTIRFVLFSGEEQGLYGSKAYAKECIDNNDKIAGVVNIDMTGYSAEKQNFEVYIARNIASKTLSDAIVKNSQTYNEYIKVNVISRVVFNYPSDQYRFWQQGMKSVSVAAMDVNPDFHTPKDLIENMNMEYTNRVAKLMIISLFDMAQPVLTNVGKTLFVDDDGGANYTTISEAVQDADDGDTVYVFNGTYNEQVIIDKAIDLIGESKENTIIKTDSGENVVITSENWAKVSGFAIENQCKRWCGAGILINSNNTVICNNLIRDNLGYAVGQYGKNNNNISDNTIQNNSDGICFWGLCSDNLISGNIIENNEVCGVIISGPSTQNKITKNLIKNCSFGIYFQRNMPIISKKMDPYSNIISNNIITKNQNGIYFIISVKNNEIIKNNITFNKQGIFLWKESNSNKIKQNNFIGNNVHASFDSAHLNKWQRNYWDNRTVSYGPKIINGQISNHFKSPVKWFNIDLFPSKKPYQIEM